MSSAIPLHRPHGDPSDLESLAEAMRSGGAATVARFEASMARLVPRPFGVAVGSPGAAYEVALGGPRQGGGAPGKHPPPRPPPAPGRGRDRSPRCRPGACRRRSRHARPHRRACGAADRRATPRGAGVCAAWGCDELRRTRTALHQARDPAARGRFRCDRRSGRRRVHRPIRSDLDLRPHRRPPPRRRRTHAAAHPRRPPRGGHAVASRRCRGSSPTRRCPRSGPPSTLPPTRFAPPSACDASNASRPRSRPAVGSRTPICGDLRAIPISCSLLLGAKAARCGRGSASA